MTQDERNMLTDLANKFAQTPAPPKDQEAEDFIRTRIGSRPDALYLMTQTVLIQNLALQHAQQQIQDLQQRAGQPVSAGSSGSFLGQTQAPPRNPGYGGGGQQYSAPPPQYAAAPVSSPSGAPSFLKGAAQTAAGVAAGALAFEGIQSLFSHPGYGGGSGFGGFGGGGFGGGGFGAAPQEEIVNNYYDNSGDNRGSDMSNVDDNQQYDDSGTQDASYDNSGDDGGSFDDGGGGDNFV